MPVGEPNRAKVWAGVILFFGIGAAIAMAVAYRMIDRGDSVVGAIFMGSCVGGFGAWFAFYIMLNALKWLRGRRRRSI